MPKNGLKRIIVIPAIALLALCMFYPARLITNLVWPLVSAFDPEKIFLPETIRYVFQLAITGLVMRFVLRVNLGQWGFNLNKWRESLRLFGWFALVTTGWLILTSLPNIISGNAPTFHYPLTARNMTGYLGFVVMAGLGEEPLFRGLVMIVIGRYW